MTIIYLAKDGSEFTTKEECIEYENRLNCGMEKCALARVKKGSYVDSFDIDLNSIVYPKNVDDFFCYYNNADYIYVPDRSMLETVKSLCTDRGYEFPEAVGWNYYDGAFYSLIEKLEISIQDTKNKLNQLKCNLAWFTSFKGE